MPRRVARVRSGPGLFEPESCRLRPAAVVRIRGLARRPPRAATRTESRNDEDESTMHHLRVWGEDLARRFGLRYAALEPEEEGVVGHFGICYADGVIRIRLRHARTDRLLKESSLVDTLCHELAHLRHFDHSIRFRRLYRRILDKARELGYYRPGTATSRGQLSLFNE